MAEVIKGNLLTVKGHRRSPPPPEPFPTEKRERPSPRRRVSPTLAKIAKRSLHADPELIRSYVPREMDLRIVEAYLSGAISFKDVAEVLGVCPATVSNAMRDPVVCGWVCQELHRAIPQRLDLVVAALFSRAVSGDVRAIELFLKKYGQIISRSINVNVGVDGTDYTQFTDADLDAMITQQKNVQQRRKNKVPAGSGGAEPPSESGPAPVLEAAPPPE